MRRFQSLLPRLERAARWNYGVSSESFSEPAALTALALIANDRLEAAQASLEWLAKLQGRNGSVGVSAQQQTPCWPTSLAVMAWQAWCESSGETAYRSHIERGVAWTLAARGTTSPRRPGIGHDPTIEGWPWVIGTHSWLEPTALCVIALKRVGYSDHGRTRDAVRLLVDRLLPEGGCNFGNTEVLGQYLVPHVQPTGIVLTALAGEPCEDPRIERSLAFLQRHVETPLGTSSLAWAAIALDAHDQPDSVHAALEISHHRTTPAAYADALCVLAETGAAAITGRITTNARAR